MNNYVGTLEPKEHPNGNESVAAAKTKAAAATTLQRAAVPIASGVATAVAIPGVASSVE